MKKIMLSVATILLFATFALADNPQTLTKDKSATKDTKATTATKKSGNPCIKDGKTCAYGEKGKDGCCKEKEGTAMKTNDDKGKK
jgi:hypothetical protein